MFSQLQMQDVAGSLKILLMKFVFDQNAKHLPFQNNFRLYSIYTAEYQTYSHSPQLLGFHRNQV